MEIKVCDFCHKQFKKNETIHLNIMTEGIENYGISFTACPDCQKKIMDKIYKMMKNDMNEPDCAAEPQEDVGLKFSNNKPWAGTVLRVFPYSLLALGQQIKKGAEKYPDINNWKKVPDAQNQYLNALMRHLIKHCSGEDVDAENGQLHLIAVVWNAMALYELYISQEHPEIVNKLME